MVSLFLALSSRTLKSLNYIELSGLLSIGLLLIRYPRAPNDYTTLCYCTFSTIHFVSIWWTWITSNIYIHPIETKLCGTTCTRVCALEDSRKGTSTLKWELHILKILMHDGHNYRSIIPRRPYVLRLMGKRSSPIPTSWILRRNSQALSHNPNDDAIMLQYSLTYKLAA